MAAAMTLMSKYRKGPFIQKQLLYYPVTNACFDTCSYNEFAAGYYLYRAGMQWFWNQYAPCQKDRAQITVSPPQGVCGAAEGSAGCHDTERRGRCA